MRLLFTEVNLTSDKHKLLFVHAKKKYDVSKAMNNQSKFNQRTVDYIVIKVMTMVKMLNNNSLCF